MMGTNITNAILNLNSGQSLILSDGDLRIESTKNREISRVIKYVGFGMV
jgi:hypothetical protein